MEDGADEEIILLPSLRWMVLKYIAHNSEDPGGIDRVNKLDLLFSCFTLLCLLLLLFESLLKLFACTRLSFLKSKG